MTIFELVKIALDELGEQGLKQYGTGLDDQVKKRLVYLRTSYDNLRDEKRTPVDYKDPATRFAYVYRYVCRRTTTISFKYWSGLGGRLERTSSRAILRGSRVSVVGLAATSLRS